jgi:molecular chaperone HscB
MSFPDGISPKISYTPGFNRMSRLRREAPSALPSLFPLFSYHHSSFPRSGFRVMQNHFQLFHLLPRFTLDRTALDAAYHEVQNQAHPDRFAHATGAEKRVAMQWATRANEAYQTLKHPLKRATYLCELNGVDIQAESNTAMPAAFLMQQMEWRERLEDLKAQRDVAALEQFEQEIRTVYQTETTAAGTLLDAGNFEAASREVRKLMFLEKFSEDVATVLDRFNDTRHDAH